MTNFKGGIAQLLAVAVVASSLTPTLSNAADIIENYSDCTCSTAPATSGVVGSITSFGGYVEYSGAGGTSVATTNAQLQVGSQVVTAVGANANVSVGASCNLTLGGNTLLSIGKSNTSSELCVAVSQTQVAPVPVATAVTTTSGSNGVGLLLLAGAGAAAYFVFSSDSDDDKSTSVSP